MNLKSVATIKHPLEIVSGSLRYRLSDLVPFLDSIEGINLVAQNKCDGGSIELIHEWFATTHHLSFLPKESVPQVFSWTEQSVWNTKFDSCAWNIEPHWPKGLITCFGETNLISAIAGRGTRLTFVGTLVINWHSEVDLPHWFLRLPNKSIEPIIANIFNRNFRKLTVGLDHFLLAEKA